MPISGWPTTTDDDGTGTSGTALNEAFFDAMETAVEGLLGSGGLFVVNGLAVGYAGPAVADQVRVGDANFYLDFDSGTSPRLIFDTGSDLFQYRRSTNAFEWYVASNLEALLDASGLQITNGLVVGFASTPTDNEVQVGDANFKLDWESSTDVLIQFDSGDSLNYARTSNIWEWVIASTSEMKLNASGLQITNGLVVGFSGTPVDDEIQLGDATFKMSAASAAFPTILFDTNDYIQYDRSANTWSFYISSIIGLLSATGLIVPGLTVGATSVTQVAGAMVLKEMTAPAAPAANEVTIFSQDNGAGKTQLMAIFSSGAAQQIAIQP